LPKLFPYGTELPSCVRDAVRRVGGMGAAEPSLLYVGPPEPREELWCNQGPHCGLHPNFTRTRYVCALITEWEEGW